VLLGVATFSTALYMGRQIFMVFFGSERTEAARHAHESPPLMTTPLIILAVLASIGGLMNLPFGGFHQLGHWLERSIVNAHVGEFNIRVAATSTALGLSAIGISYLLYGRKPLGEGEKDPLYRTGSVFTFLNHEWYWDDLYSIIADAFKGWGLILSRPVDMGIVDGAVNGIAQLVEGSSRSLRRVQTGYVRNYALAVLLGVVAILVYLAVRFLV
jgi:NADH-quinone oxidoreductase subunit L